ncbi:MAG: beta-ketoacyl-ACP synthase III [Planctomycetota bacterium]|nr:beta-ketoacyl-ACP synthase III [Planctomycetota bacterium]
MASPSINRKSTRIDEASRRLISPSHKRIRALPGIQIVGMGSYLPEQIVSNEQLNQDYGFDPDWIFQRTGIRERRYALPEQATSDLCFHAAQKAIEDNDVPVDDIDLVVVATFTPDMAFPSTACLVQSKLGLNAAAMDIQAACSGFMYAMITAAQYVATGCSNLALVIGGDCNSRILNPKDQGTFPLFGDGAGAVLISRGSKQQGLMAYQLGSDGSGGHLLQKPAGGSRLPISNELIAQDMQYLQMDGRAVFKWAIRILTDSIEEVLAAHGKDVDDISLMIAHQANIRILKAATDVLTIPANRTFNNLDRYGNTSSASIPIALDEAYRENRFKQDDLLLLSGFGAGLTWGTALFQW